MQAQPLNLLNDNNKLACEGFNQIHFAPPHFAIKESDFEKIYCIKKDGEEIFVKLVDFLRIEFQHIGSVFTIPAAGMQSDEWAKEWVKKYPKTKPDTEMAIYSYLRDFRQELKI